MHDRIGELGGWLRGRVRAIADTEVILDLFVNAVAC